MIELKNIQKNYGKKQALKDVNLTIKPGEIFGLIGQNGAGKSTLLKMLGGLTYPSSGNINLFGVKLSPLFL